MKHPSQKYALHTNSFVRSYTLVICKILGAHNMRSTQEVKQDLGDHLIQYQNQTFNDDFVPDDVIRKIVSLLMEANIKNKNTMLYEKLNEVMNQHGMNNEQMTHLRMLLDGFSREADTKIYKEMETLGTHETETPPARLGAIMSTLRTIVSDRNKQLENHINEIKKINNLINGTAALKLDVLGGKKEGGKVLLVITMTNVLSQIKSGAIKLEEAKTKLKEALLYLAKEAKDAQKGKLLSSGTYVAIEAIFKDQGWGKITKEMLDSATKPITPSAPPLEKESKLYPDLSEQLSSQQPQPSAPEMTQPSFTSTPPLFDQPSAPPPGEMTMKNTRPGNDEFSGIRQLSKQVDLYKKWNTDLKLKESDKLSMSMQPDAIVKKLTGMINTIENQLEPGTFLLRKSEAKSYEQFELENNSLVAQKNILKNVIKEVNQQFPSNKAQEEYNKARELNSAFNVFKGELWKEIGRVEGELKIANGSSSAYKILEGIETNYKSKDEYKSLDEIKDDFLLRLKGTSTPSSSSPSSSRFRFSNKPPKKTPDQECTDKILQYIEAKQTYQKKF